MTSERISSKLVYPSKYIEVNGSKMHYVEAGEGNPILLLHGVPTSSYIWRNIIPHLAPLGRCIAPDLIGFGKSDKPSIEYTIFDHINYIEAFIKQLNLKNLTLIMHGWGSVIGFHYAMSHEKNCSGLVFYEAFLRTLSTGDNSLAFQEQVLELSNEGIYDAAVNGSIFVDKIL
jgi:haloalkane dehalogenase